MKITTYSIQELSKQGYKARLNGRGYYLGDSKYPTHEISSQMENLLGRELTVLNITNGKVLVQPDNTEETFYVKPWLIKSKLPKFTTIKTIIDDDIMTYNGFVFKLPYGEILKKDAIKIAAFITRNAK
jgi:hypothetical protein